MLDDALKRPGRFDVHVQFEDASPTQAEDLFAHFFKPKTAIADKETDSAIEEKSMSDEATPPGKAFTDAIFDRPHKLSNDEPMSFSMAALQGYLLRNKQDPQAAAQQARAWADDVEAKREAEIQAKAEAKAKRFAAKAEKASAEAVIHTTPLTPVSSD